MKKNETYNVSGLPRIVREINLQVVVREMRRNKTFSKIDLARNCGISTTTMTKLFAHLEANHLIEQSPEIDTSFGRPKTFYQLSPVLQIASIVIDVEQSTLSFSNLQGNGDAKHQTTFQTGNNTKDLFARIRKAYKACQRNLNTPCRMMGICIPGLIENPSGRSVLNPNIRWLEGSHPAAEIQKQLSVPTFIIHEEKALSRVQYSIADDAANYIALDFSAGVGMNIVANGKHVSGTSGFAGEIGHVVMNPRGKRCGCGNRGCLETIASDRILQTEIGLPMETALQQLTEGKARSIEVADRIIAAQAIGVAMAINIFNPERIFIYSRMTNAYPDYMKKLRHHTQKLAIPLSFEKCTLETAREGKLKGALLLTIDRLIAQAIGSHTEL